MHTDNLARLIGEPVEVHPPPLPLLYPQRQLRREAAKAGLGLLVCGGAVVFLEPLPVMGWMLGLAGMLFAAYTAQQLRRLWQRLELTQDGVAQNHSISTAFGGQARARTLPWSELEKFRLHFYPHSRKASQGLLVLSLRGGGVRLKVDSTLEGFPSLLERSAQVARERGLFLHPTTMTNLSELGL